MDVESLGYRTDLALLRLGGSTIEDRGDHLVVRSPYNPHVLLGQLPAARPRAGRRRGDAAVARPFAQEFPASKHVAIGIDGTTGTPEDLQAFVDLGMTREVNAVMTATVGPPAAPPQHRGDVPQAGVRRRLGKPRSRSGWRSTRARSTTSSPTGSSSSPRPRPHVSCPRTVTARGSAPSSTVSCARRWAWCGPTPASRASRTSRPTRTPAAAAWPARWCTTSASTALTELGASTLVMVADPDYLAIRVYRSVGFETTEAQLQVERS